MYPSNNKNIDIIKDILLLPIALADRLGQKVYKYLEANIIDGNDNNLLHINLKNANPIDYRFIVHAFGKIYFNILANDHSDIIFYIHEVQKKHLLWGLLKYSNIKIKDYNKLAEEFGQKFTIKVVVDKHLIFISNLDEYALKVLEYINEKIMVDIHTLNDTLRSQIKQQDIMIAIETLKKNKLIYAIVDEHNIEYLYSINKFLYNYE